MRAVMRSTFATVGLITISVIASPGAAMELLLPSTPGSPGVRETTPPELGEQAPEADDQQSLQQELAAAQAAHYREKWYERWAPIEPGTYVALSALKIERLRVQYAAVAYQQVPDRPGQFPLFTVVVTLGASPDQGHPALREAFFHTASVSEAVAIVHDLRSGRARGLWIERFTATSTSGKAGAWWQIRAIDY